METQPSMGDQFLTLVKQIIEDQIGNEDLTVSTLAKEVGLSRSMLHRKLIRLTGKSATELITETRLQKALELLENNVATVSEIAYRVGYSSPSYFNKVFKKTYNVSPGDIRKKGSGKLSHLRVVKDPGIPGSTRSRKSRSLVIGGINVLMIIIVAGGAVALILGSGNNVFPFSRIPEWTMVSITILFSLVFIVSVIFSWRYDLYFEKRMVKTEPANKIEAGDEYPVTNRWKIGSYIGIVVIVVLIILNILPRANRKSTIENSIAVLPFRNDSPDQENDHIINGTMESILNNLSKISELRVVPRTSVERYRNGLESVPEICSELNVGYVLEGSMQKYGDQIRLTLQLVDKDEYHLWSEQYDRQIKDADQYFALYSEIALLVADEINVILTPEEKQLIEKIHTTELTAWDFYSRGNEELLQFSLDEKNLDALVRAKSDFKDALKYDNKFAGAYVGLGWIYYHQNFWEEYYDDNFLDSCLFLANKALSIDNRFAEAFILRGYYYKYKSDDASAIEEFEHALSLNPNSWEAHYSLSELYSNDDILKAIEHSHKAIQLYRGPQLANILINLSGIYLMVGCIDQGVYYMNEILRLENDSAEYFLAMAGIGTITADHEMALEYGLKAYQYDSTDYMIHYKIAESYFYLKQYKEAISYWLKQFADNPSAEVRLNQLDFRIGVAYWALGDQEEALLYVNNYKEHCIKSIELGRRHATMYYAYYDLAGIYSLLGEKEKAYENLRIFNQKERIPLWWATLIKNDPLFDNIRGEPEFQQIVHNTQAKYQAEYERVRKWLEENDLL